MKRVWKKIENMIARGDVHNRNNFSLAEVKPPLILGHAKEELSELEREPDNHWEMADLLGVLIHYCIKQGWKMELIEAEIIAKLDLRFTKGKVS